MVAGFGLRSSQSNFQSSGDEVGGMGKGRFIRGSGWICQEQRSCFKVRPDGRAGNERNSMARVRTRSLRGLGRLWDTAQWGEEELTGMGRAWKMGCKGVLVKNGPSCTTIIHGNCCLKRLEVFKRLRTPQGQSSAGPSSLETPERRAEPGILWRDGPGGWQGSLGRAGLCRGELAAGTVTACVHSMCFSWLLSRSKGYKGMSAHADKNSPPGLLSSGVFSPELLFFPFSPRCRLAASPPPRAVPVGSVLLGGGGHGEGRWGHSTHPALLHWRNSKETKPTAVG